MSDPKGWRTPDQSVKAKAMQVTTALPIDAEVRIPVAGDFVFADLVVPARPSGLVVFAHGSGSSRHSPRNMLVAKELQRRQLGTLLLDLLTQAEEQRDMHTSEHRFDIPLLAERLVAATRWLRSEPELRALTVGYFGASTGSAAALVAAAELQDTVEAVVSRGGRPDLAGESLSRVSAATLLIVGGKDDVVIGLNARAYQKLRCKKDLAIVPGATHLFEEPGTLERVCELAGDWFVKHLEKRPANSVSANAMNLFKDRHDAGRKLAQRLMPYRGKRDVIVLGLPRGGVPVAFEVAQALHVPLDVFIVRKLGVPGHEEYAMGAIASGGIRVMNPEAAALSIPQSAIDAVAAREEKELERRERLYRGTRPPLDLSGRTVILVDDGLATGSTMRAAALAIRQQRPARIVVAVPVAAVETCDEFRREVDEIVCGMTPQPFRAVGVWYEDFTQTTDAEVHALLNAASHPTTEAAN